MKACARVAAITAFAISVGGQAQPNGPAQFRFDDGFRSTGGLTFSFSRPVETLDDAGTPVGADQPRFAPAESIAAAPVVTQIRGTPGGIPILGSGFDHDGSTPLLVVYQISPPRLDVFTVAGDALLASEAGGPGRVRTVLDGGGDIMRGAYPGRRFVPATAAVACGLITILCDVREKDAGGLWKDSGIAFVASQDQGRSWTLVYDDGPVQIGHKRAREWSMTNWWPLSLGPDPLEAWFAATDYRANPGSTGGRAVMMRATRAAVGQQWVLEKGLRFYEQELGGDEHFHSAAILPCGQGGLRAIVSIGDGQPINRIVSLSRADLNYLSPGGWTVDEAYHGSRGSQGNQFCGAAPFAGGALVGGDVGNEQIMRLSGDSPHPATSFIYGLGTATQGNAASNFVIRTPSPNIQGSPYVGWSQLGLKAGGTKFARRILYSPDGLRWMQAITPESDTPPTIAIHGDHIYFERRDAPKGFFRAPLPTFLTGRPLEIGPGGVQRLVSAPTVVNAKGGTITALKRSPDGLWLDGGQPIDPQPPCLGQVYRVKASRSAPTTLIGTIRPTGAGADFGNNAGTDAVATRVWIRNLDPGKTARPRINIRSSDKSTARFEDMRINITDRWLPITPAHTIPVAPGQRLEYLIYSALPVPDDEDFYLALDVSAEGAGFCGYALGPDLTNPPTGTRYPDETASIAALQCGAAWTVTLAGALPFAGVDNSVGTNSRWPLAAVWADSSSFVRLIADTSRRRLVIEIYRNGAKAGSIESTEVYFLRGSPVLISLADAGDGTGIRASLSVGGLPAREATPTAGWTTASLASPPTEVRFGDGSGLSGDGVKVRQTPMLWWGGQIDRAIARTDDQRRALLESLSFLTLPPGRPGCAADLDGDGSLSLFDFLQFEQLFIAGDPRADLDQSSGPGVLDAADFAAFIAEFSGGCA